MSATAPKEWKHLERRPKSFYRQLFIKGTRIRAEVIYGLTVDGDEPMTPSEVAADYGLPVEVVQECIDYCLLSRQVIEADHAREERLMEATGMNDPNYKGQPTVLSGQGMARTHSGARTEAGR
jgi:uncharacterized protein (DUF433 family)